jgi:hypothetical protein
MFLKILLLSHITLYVFIMILHGVYFILFSLIFIYLNLKVLVNKSSLIRPTFEFEESFNII